VSCSPSIRACILPFPYPHSIRGNWARPSFSRGPDISGAVNSLGYNLIGSTADATITGILTGNLTDDAASPLNLGLPQNNGGPTRTMVLEDGSVAIDAGDPAFAPPPDFDQRGEGFPRVAGGRIDIGAYEK
jgi:hypothetical protein